MIMQTSSVLSSEGKLKLIIFDCDGVLVDSETICCQVSAEEARLAGMEAPEEKAVEQFSGMALSLIQQKIEKQTGKNLGHDWISKMQKRFIEAMEDHLEPVDGVYDMLKRVEKLSVPVRVGSNSSALEMDLKFKKLNMTPYFQDRIHSAQDMGKPKPAPDVYIKAASDEGVKPENCIVLEDSDTGARAAVNAGMMCVLLRAPGLPVPDWPGLKVIHHLSEFSDLIENTINIQKE
ncbi:HAD family hydrolase [Acetobacter thailandicus]